MNTRELILTAALLLPTSGTLQAQDFDLARLNAADITSTADLPVPEASIETPAAVPPISKAELAAYLADWEPVGPAAEKGARVEPAQGNLGGDGVVKLYHQWSKESLEIRYRGADGRYLPAAMAKIKRLFRCRLTGKEIEVPTQLVEILDAIQDRSGGRTLTIICGYRSPELNGQLSANSGAVAKKSLHMKGLAADIRIDGISTSALRDTAKALKAGGVGYYPADGFVHVDVGSVRYW